MLDEFVSKSLFQDVYAKFVEFIRKENDHIMFVGKLTKEGYGRFKYGGCWRYGWLAHKVWWELKFGMIPNRGSIYHICSEKACVSLDHLFLGPANIGKLVYSLKESDQLIERLEIHPNGMKEIWFPADNLLVKA